MKPVLAFYNKIYGLYGYAKFLRQGCLASSENRAGSYVHNLFGSQLRRTYLTAGYVSSLFIISILDILGIRAGPQMLRINTARIVAGMTNVASSRYLTFKQLKAMAMCSYLFTIDAYSTAVAFFVQTSGPQPARTRLIYIRHKAFNNVLFAHNFNYSANMGGV